MYSKNMKKDTDLDAIRSREDFKKLLAELEAKEKSKEKRGQGRRASS